MVFQEDSLDVGSSTGLIGYLVFPGFGCSEFQDLDVVLRWILAFFLIQGYGAACPEANLFDGGPFLPDERRFWGYDINI